MDSSISATRIKDVMLVQTTDFFYPNVDDPYWQGRISAANVLSDLYAMGVPDCDNMLMLLGICRNPQLLASDKTACAKLMMEGFRDTAQQAGTNITGGQTVVSPWFIVGGVASTVAFEKDILRPLHAVVGDVLVLTKPLGTQVASNVHVWLSKPEKWSRIQDLITKEEAEQVYTTMILSMARLNRNGAKLMMEFNAHAATDVTGFGILGHAKNLASNQTASVDFVIHTLPIIKKMAAVNSRVEYKLIQGSSAETSGGLLISMPKADAERYCKALEELDGWPAWIVGDVVAGSRQAKIIDNVKVVEVDWRGYETWRE
jgi:selenide,water dikinase